MTTVSDTLSSAGEMVKSVFDTDNPTPKPAEQPLTFNPSDVAPPKPTYSHVSSYKIVGPCKIINVAGQVGLDPITHRAGATFHEQIQLALSNLRQCLAAGGATTKDVVKVTQYVVNLDPKDTKRAELYLEFMGDHLPPSTLISVPSLADPAWLYEIDAMAIVSIA